MSKYPISHEITIEAPIEVVWRIVTEAEQICQWFSQEVELTAQPGELGTLTFPPGPDGTRLKVHITVVTVEPPHRFSFRWIYPDGENATATNSMLVSFTLSPVTSERTLLQVNETGLDGLGMTDDEKSAYVNSHMDGWKSCGERLSALFDSGRAPSS